VLGVTDVQRLGSCSGESIIGPSTIRSAAPVLQSLEGGGQNSPSACYECGPVSASASVQHGFSSAAKCSFSAFSRDSPALSTIRIGVQEARIGRNRAQRSRRVSQWSCMASVQLRVLQRVRLPAKGCLGQMSDLILGW